MFHENSCHCSTSISCCHSYTQSRESHILIELKASNYQKKKVSQCCWIRMRALEVEVCSRWVKETVFENRSLKITCRSHLLWLSQCWGG